MAEMQKDKLKVERLKKFLTELQEVKGEVCKHKECGQFSCPACIGACYGEECAFDAVEDAICDLQEIIESTTEQKEDEDDGRE